MINLNKKQLAIVTAVGIAIIGIIGYYIYTITSDKNYEQIEQISEQTDIKNTEKVENDEEEYIVVHIAGEVKKSGIVRLKEGARIADVIEQAEGLTEKANITNINLAYIVEDGQKITIPSKEQTKETEEHILESGAGQAIEKTENGVEIQETSKIININKASKEELQTLKGIGESTAEKIIEYRKQNGNFKQIEDIKNVPGIGDAKYEGIKDNIKI